MSPNVTTKDIKKFKRFYLVWLASSLVIICVGICFIISHSNVLVRIDESRPYWLPTLATVWGAISSFIAIFEFNGHTKATREMHNRLKIGMIASLLILIWLLMLVICYSVDNHLPKRNLACNTVLNDSSLHHGTTINSNGYVIESVDPVNVNNLSCSEYAKKKIAILKSLLAKCDAKLIPMGYGATGQKLSKYLDDGDTNKVILNELLSTFFVYINEKTYLNKEDYFYEATVCVAKRNTLDSLAAAALTKLCMKGVWQEMVTGPLQKNPTIQITISLDDIFQRVYRSCPSDVSIQKIKAACGGSYTCDSIYFISGHYQLADASKMLLESLFNELRRNSSERFHVTFYGYTDPRNVWKPIPYLDDGSFSNINVLLPDSTSYQYRLETITDNDQLSFARAYSCYDFMKKYLSAHITGQYTGAGESNNGSDYKLQRTVKIVIKKL